MSVAQQSDSQQLPFKLVDEWGNACITSPGCKLSVQALPVQTEAVGVPNTRRKSSASATPLAAPGFKLASGKLTACRMTDHLLKVSAALGDYNVTFHCTCAGKVLSTAVPLRVTVTKSALPGSIRWLLSEELHSGKTQTDELPDIKMSWSPVQQAGEQSSVIFP